MKEIDLEKLFEIASEGALSLEEELSSFAKLLRRNFELRLFWESVSYSKEDKKKLLLEIFPEATELFRDLIYLLIDRGWEKKILELSQDFTRLVSEKLSINFVEIKSAFPLTGEDRKRIENFVGGKTRLRIEVDSSLIGGLKLQTFDGRYFDASLQGRLEKLKEDLINA
jgi:ATP synthase F1 delta subunit